MMLTAWEYYSSAFSASQLFGLRMIISWASTLIMLWCVGLAMLLWRANSKSSENRFMAVLLVCEGIKASFLLSTGILYMQRYEWLQDILWIYTIDVFFAAHITAIILYFCLPMFYKVNRLSFLYGSKLKPHVWYLAPALGISIYLLLKGLPEFYVSDAAWIICTEGSPARYEMWFGTYQPWIGDAVASIGMCTANFETTVTTQPPGLWAIALGSPLVSLVALFFLRPTYKSQYVKKEKIDGTGLASRSLYIGFLGKVIGLLIWFALIAVIVPLLHGGQVTFTDEAIWRYGAEQTALDRLKFFLWTISLICTPAAIAFEALMFVHASLNDSVYGIDQNLRKTFRAAMFTGLGAFLFIISTEAMEQVLGQGLLGGVMIGVLFLGLRSPVLRIIDGVSGRLIPANYTPEETAYLEAYKTAMEDLIITVEERRLLETLAKTYALEPERVREIEQEFDAMLEEE